MKDPEPMAEQPRAEPHTTHAYPDELTPALRDVLGLMNFQTCPIAHGFQAAGYDIARKAEAEQAFVLHWLIKLALQHGDDWRRHAGAELQRIKALADARAAGANPTGRAT